MGSPLPPALIPRRFDFAHRPELVEGLRDEELLLPLPLNFVLHTSHFAACGALAAGV